MFEQLARFELDLDFESRIKLFSLQKEVVQAERDRQANEGSLTPEYELYNQFVIERCAKCLMINGSYSLAIGSQNQLASAYKRDIEKIKGIMDLWNQDLIDKSLYPDADLVDKLDQAVKITRRSVDHARVLMHNGNFIDA